MAMLLMIGAWISCSMLLVWAMYVAGRLRSATWSKIALLLGTMPMVFLMMGQLPLPRFTLVDLAWLGAISAGLLGIWGVAVHWARRLPASPKVDASRMRWLPRASHRPTWVIAVGLSTVLTLALVALDRPLVGLLPWVALFVAHRWAHQGERGTLRVEARDIVLAGERIAIEALAPVLREVRYLGPVRRERLVLQHGDRQLHWLVTGSPAEHVLAVQHLLQQQQDHAASHTALREPLRLPPAWLLDIQENGLGPVALRSDRKAT